MKKKFTISMLLLFTLIVLETSLRPCTVAVVSGKGTADGKPLLWKNRDTDEDESRVMFFKGDRFNFLGIVNASDLDGKEVWAGMNSAGFCIINSASYNLNYDLKKRENEDSSYKRPKDEEGLFMKKALSTCASLVDFERLLNDTKEKRGIDSNFGIIDAMGGAAFFETGVSGYVKFDANDAQFAPEGYIIRTNYSYTGEKNEGAGYIRFDRASELFHKQSASGSIDFVWILVTASRDMVNGMTGIDPLNLPLPASPSNRKMYHMNDCLTRPSAAATIVFNGVKAGDDPFETIMWTRLGHPLCSVAMPVWISSFQEATLLISKDSAPISRFALLFHRKIFPYGGGNRYQYMDIAPAVNLSGNGFLFDLINLEKEVIEETGYFMRTLKTGANSLESFQQRINQKIRKDIKTLFPIEARRAGID